MNTCRFWKKIHLFINQKHKARFRLDRCFVNKCNARYMSVGNPVGAQFKSSVGSELEKWIKIFERNSIGEPESSAVNILAHCLGTRNLSKVHQLEQRELSQEEIDLVEQLCRQRLNRIPIQYIIGEWPFRSLTLKMTAPVFVPRPETENLVDLVLEEIDRRDIRHFLEPCCGSGAIALSILQERPQTTAIAFDQSVAACRLTIENAKRHNLLDRLEVFQGRISEEQPQLNFLENLKFDLIVSNPPYVPTADIDRVQPEIKLHEDLSALDGGQDGLDIIRLLLKMCQDEEQGLLCAGGKMFLEVDISHPDLLRTYVSNSCPELELSGVHRDFTGKLRFVEVVKRK